MSKLMKQLTLATAITAGTVGYVQAQEQDNDVLPEQPSIHELMQEVARLRMLVGEKDLRDREWESGLRDDLKALYEKEYEINWIKRLRRLILRLLT